MPLFHSNFKIRNSVPSGPQPVGLNNWQDVLSFLSPDNGNYVSAWDALQNPDVQSAVTQIAGDLASAKLKSDKPRIQGILDNPSKVSNARTFWVAMFAQMILGGEAFAYRWRNVNGVDDHWEYLRPSQVQTFQLSDGSGLIYMLSFDEPDIGIIENVPSSDMIHIRYFSMNGMTGISPLYSLANTLNIKNKSDQLTLSALAQSITVNSTLELPGQVSDNYAMARAKTLMKQVQTSGGVPVTLMPGEKLMPLEIKSNIASLLQQVDWTSTQIAKALQIPDSYLNGQGDQQSSIEQIQGMYSNTLHRDMQMVLSELNLKLTANITADIRKAIDPLYDNYAKTLLSTRILQPAQITQALKDVGYLSENIPDAVPVVGQPPQKGENE